MKQTIIYLRTSTEEQNPQNQLNDCLSINKYGDYELITDKQSAWKDNKQREGFEKLKALIKAGNIKHLIVWDFDRIYRNRKKFVSYLTFLKSYGVKLHSYRQNWFEDIHKIPEPWNDIVNDLMINIYGHIAEEESNKKSERVKASRKTIQGKTYSKYGKKWGRKTIITERLCKHIIDLYEQGYSIRQIARQVYAYDKNKNKKSVSIATIHKIVKAYKK